MVVASPVTRARKALLAVVLGASLTASAPNAGAQNVYSDQTIYGWATFDGSTGGSCYNSNSFTSYTGWGRRYYVVVKHGATHATSVSLSIDGQEWVGSSEFSSGADSVTRIIDLSHPTEGQTASHNLSICVTGPSGSSVSVRVYHLTEPTFVVYGQHTFNRLDPIADETTSFLNSYEATTPYLLRMINGAGDGSNRVANAYLYLNNTGIFGPYDFGTGIATLTREVYLLGPVYNFEADYEDVVKGRNESSTGTFFKAEIRGTDASAPWLAVTSSSPTDGLITEASSVTVAGSALDDQTKVLVTVSDSTTGVANTPVRGNGSFSDAFAMAADGPYTIEVHAQNSAGLAATDVFRHVTRDTQAPVLTITQPAAGPQTTTAATLQITGSWSDLTLSAVSVDGDPIGSGTSGSISYSYPLDLGPNRILFKAVDALGHVTTFTRYVLREIANEQVRDSTISAPVLSSTEITSFLDQVKFLYTQGSPRLQTGAIVDSIKADRAAVVRGRVLARDFGGFANDTVTVLGHPEYGLTVTRADGRFDLVVNGGAQLTLRFTKDGYLEAQRQVQPPVNDFVTLDDVAIIGKTQRRSILNLTAGPTASSRMFGDANGERRLGLYFPSGTVAKVGKAPGDTVAFSAIRVRVSEYTVGSSGLSTMPAVLPPGSAYTYAVNLSTDEADSLTAAGQPAPNMVFTNPVPAYVRKFLSLPVGTALPLGYYDMQHATWLAAKDGWVIKILSTSGGSATLDTNGDGLADGASRLDGLGVTAAERQQLAGQYAAGDTLWRVLLDHFSTADINLNLAAITNAQSSAARRAGQPQGLIPDHCEVSGSIIECENRVLGQRIPIVGTPYTLNYRSFRAPGDSAIRTLRIPVTGDSIPTGLDSVIVVMEVAGTRQRLAFAAPSLSVNQVVTMTWDGNDAYGRRVEGSAAARVSIGYRYGVLYAGGNGLSSLGNSGWSSGTVSKPVADRSVGRISWARRTVSLGAPSTGSAGLGGWTISPHHFYDMNGQGALYYGDGSVLLGWRQYPIAMTAAGNGNMDPQTEGVPAISTALVPRDVVRAPDGSLYIADALRGAILRVDRNGILTRIAGQQSPGNYTTDGPATETPLREPSSLVVAPDGSIYFVMRYAFGGCPRACKVSPDGMIVTVAGTGESSPGGYGDGGPATAARFVEPNAIALGPDGSIFVGDGGDRRVRRIGPNGIITTYAGTGSSPSAGTNYEGKATQVGLVSIDGLACDADGNLFIAEGQNYRVCKITPDGTLKMYSRGEGASPLHASAFQPRDVAVGPDGALYIASNEDSRVWRRDDDGTLAPIAGVGAALSSFDDGMPAAGVSLNSPQGIDLAPDGTIYVAEVNGRRIRRIAGTLPTRSTTEFAVPSEDGSEIYFFGLTGRHLYTRDALTGAVRFRFAYDGAGRLSRVYDVNGDSTRIERSGSSITITAPYGQPTLLTLDGAGWLASVTNPKSETVALTTYANGLLQTYRDARLNLHSFIYEADGRLKLDSDPAGGSQDLSVAYAANNRTVTRKTGELRTTTYSVTDLFDGTRQRSIIGPDGLRTYLSDSTDGRSRVALPDASVGVDSLLPDPRFGMLAPMLGRVTERLPSGIVRSSEVRRPMDPGFNPPFTPSTWREELTINGRPPLRTVFNATTRQFTFTTPLNRQVTASVDSAGRPLTVTVAGLEALNFTYDARGRLQLAEQGERGWRYGYDTKGRLATVRDTLHRATALGYDDADRLTSLVLPGGRQVLFNYDANGNLTSLTPPGRPAHELDYTAVDLTDRYRPPAAGLPASLTQYRYNKDRQLTRVEQPDSGNVRLDYQEPSGRLTAIGLPRGTFGISYDNLTGHVSTISSPDTVTLTYGWNGTIDTVTTWSGKVAGTVSVALDQDFRVSSQRVNGGSTIAFGYDADGLLTSAGDLTITRRTDNGLMSGTSLGSLATSESQTGAGEPWRVDAKFGATTLWEATYGRDLLGRITSVTETVQGVTKVKAYAYSDSGFLTVVTEDGAVTERFSYDGNGNRLRFERAAGADTSTADYDDQDRLLRYKDTRYTYTAAGYLATVATGSDITRYTYDPLGNLVTVQLPNGDLIDYLIDGQQRRVGRKLNGVLQRTWLYGDQLEPVAELDGAGNLVSRFAYGSRSHVPDYIVKATTTYRIISDHLGSVRLVVDVASGTVAQRMDYDAYGQVVLDTNPGLQPFGYVGGSWEAATGLVRFGVRDYSPTVGRWISRDPQGPSPASLNLYTYAEGDPINETDVTGYQLDSYSAAVRQCVSLRSACAREECLRGLLETVDAGRRQKLIDLIMKQQRLQKTAQELLSSEIKGSAKSEFPSELLNKTLEQIQALARAGNDAAQTALKLLTQSKFRR